MRSVMLRLEQAGVVEHGVLLVDEPSLVFVVRERLAHGDVELLEKRQYLFLPEVHDERRGPRCGVVDGGLHLRLQSTRTVSGRLGTD